jgi:Trk-type K+ transport system membrane component
MVRVDQINYVTAMSSVIAMLMNIGPGFGAVGPSENYADISNLGKGFLSWNMLVGRWKCFQRCLYSTPLSRRDKRFQAKNNFWTSFKCFDTQRTIIR